ncbi:aminotransferase class III-fold pyridoxal phosphate-dependent enzyme [Taibaiella lutea]|uniref:Aminotransferase class III-fold pyridoxal phosphate-dependent enzyme n=1 Tax=Taibaiella lutea TaxID=2608001 RepID=A0A5M6CF86_9BACT|nr:aminotransferase class III-fold pyridoxal phosphate-dependent enzyme [Taibaiella lutea]KAA5533706.1 aminotransferase class III-fold pyridoxal phosphate-dependent enzyme [Taibaiella lutea]
MRIVSAGGDFLIDESGFKYFDLCMGYGSVCLGHNYPPVINEQLKQLQTYASPGFIESDIYVQAKHLLEKHIQGYHVHGFYPSGANAVEIAVKLAMQSKGLPKIISFAKSMHGKTIFANKLGFESYLQDDDQIIRIPFLGEKTEHDVLKSCEAHMQSGNVAAIIIEPIQMSGGGFKGHPQFYRNLEQLAVRFGVIQIYDEILTGFYRTGSPFFFKTQGVKPDIVLAGKAIGSGFPVSAVMIEKTFVISDKFRGGGTFFNHPMACASIVATINACEQLDLAARTHEIELCILKHLPAQHLSGQGALWNIDLGSVSNANAAVKELLANKIIVTYYDKYIRFFPSFRVDLSHLIKACQIVKRYL